MVAAQQLALAELVDVAPHGLRRDREMLGQRLDRDEAALAHQVDDLLLPGILWHRPSLPKPILSGRRAFASQHRGRRRCSRAKRLALDEGGRLPGSSGPTKSRQRGGVMASGRSILAIDQGTTSTRAILFDQAGQAPATAPRELPQTFPPDAWGG